MPTRPEVFMRFIKESKINATPARVFAFHESPGALPRLTPPWEKMTLESGGQSIQVGSRVVLKTTLGPIPLRWVAEHVEYAPPHAFADIQLSGPFAKWHHRHEFLDDGQGGTILRDVVDYELPLGAVGQFFGGGFVRSKLDRMFNYRHEVTKKIVEADDFPES